MPDADATQTESLPDRYHYAKHLISMRRRRDTALGDIFGEPAWDMLLNLYVAAHERQEVSVSSLCTAIALPASSALRWIGVLVQKGALVRYRDPTDARRVNVVLSESAHSALDRLLAESAVMASQQR